MFLDHLFTLIHLLIIGFNLTGWIWPGTRKFHFMVVCLTAGCWLILGIWCGLGYCPVTDWQWKIKQSMGETNLPASFIKYFADKISGQDISPTLINWMTGICFVLAAVLSTYLNFFKSKDSGAES